jgi:hypothetical protein
MALPNLIDLLQDPELLEPAVVLVITVNEKGEPIKARATDLAEAMMLLKDVSAKGAQTGTKEEPSPSSLSWRPSQD